MLAKQHRLPTTFFAHKQHHRVCFSWKGLYIHITEYETSSSRVQWGVVIPSASIPLAHDRNALRRRVFEWVRGRGLYTGTGRAIVVFVKKEAKNVSFSLVWAELEIYRNLRW